MSGGSKTQTTNENQKSETHMTQKPIAPEGWEQAWRDYGLGLNENGLTADQETALASLRGNMGAGSALLLDPTVSTISKAVSGDPGYGYAWSTSNLQQAFPELYKKIADVTAQTITPNVTAQTVQGKTGAQYMDAYRNPFEDQVVQSSLDDLERQYNLALTKSGSMQQAGGAFGGSATALQNALTNNDYLRTVASTAGNLRSQGFNAAAGYGQQDATRVLQGDVANQGANLQASGLNLDAMRANQSSALQAATQNQSNETQRQEFDANVAMKAQDVRNAAATNWASLMTSALGIDNQTAMALLGAGTTGQSQALNWLNMGGRLFGQQTDGTSSGTSSGTTTQSSSPGFLDVLGGIGSLIGGLGNLGWKPFSSSGPTSGNSGGMTIGNPNALFGNF